MIGFLRGNVKALEPPFLILDVQGVGYEIHASKALLAAAPGEGMSVWTHAALRSDSMELYGFSSLEEKRLFLKLLKVSGVGPKMALGILGAASPPRLLEMLQAEDVKSLSALPKVGKKTAARILLSLRGSFVKDSARGVSAALRASAAPQSLEAQSAVQAREALERLGFSHDEIERAFREIKWRGVLKEDLKSAFEVLSHKALNA